ncbi:unnamed protein product, partial [Polarella glacialis]
FEYKSFTVKAIVEGVDDKGDFTLSFPSLDSATSSSDNAGAVISTCDKATTAQVPADFIGPGGAVAGASQALQRTSIFATGNDIFGSTRTTHLFRPVQRSRLFGSIDADEGSDLASDVELSTL